MRVVRSADFQSIFRDGQVATDSLLVVHALTSIRPTRLGISISRRTGCAVVRNRWKRCVREAFRLNYQHLPDNLVLVVRPRKGARPNVTAISSSLVKLTKQLSRRVLSQLPEN
jgi:ribonuclease P protein component